MREIHRQEKKQRGCAYCYWVVETGDRGGLKLYCPYEGCVYHELDSHESYERYLKATGKAISMKEILKDIKREDQESL